MNAELEHRHPTIGECEKAGVGLYLHEREDGTAYKGGLPDTPEERARFEAYMRGHCWAVGTYDPAQHCYDTSFVRCAYGVWRDRGALRPFAEHPEFQAPDEWAVTVIDRNEPTGDPVTGVTAGDFRKAAAAMSPNRY